jgi:two-component sensor histidine kinase
MERIRTERVQFVSVNRSMSSVTEELRLAALRRYQILDTLAESALDRLTAFAAGLLRGPIAFIALVEAQRIWFKSRFGIAREEIERTEGLCSTCILHNAPFIVADASLDPRLTADPLVCEEGVRFYCGAPLRTSDSFNIGVLAVADRIPRTLEDAQVRQLAALSRILMDEIELRHVARLAQSSHAAETARRELREDHIRGLMRELAHRSKNLLAVVQALAWQTTTSSSSVREYAQNLTERIQGLAQTHDLMAEEEWRGIATDDLVRSQLAVLHDDSRVELDGPHIVLSSTAAQHIGLALTELATNALKHGAFAQRRGRVSVNWHIEGATHLVLLWRELMQSNTSPPQRRGFGIMVLERITPEALSGKGELSFEPSGLRYRLRVPLANAQRDA